MTSALGYLALRGRHEDFLDWLVDLGVLTRGQADTVGYRQVLPELMPCLPVYTEEVWEAIAAWEQYPDRCLDPETPKYHRSRAVRFAIHYGPDDRSVRDALARAEELERNPAPKRTSPSDRVKVEGGRRREPENVETGSGSVELLEAEGHREDAAHRRRVRGLVRG